MDADALMTEIGLLDADLRAYLQKLNQFYVSLTESEKKVFLASMPSFEEAAATFNTAVTPQELKDFLQVRMPAEANFINPIQGTQK